jgi:hypothetical protein
MDEARYCALDWIAAEHAIYEGNKFDRDLDDEKTPDDWYKRIDNYLKRAEVLGLDNPLGRQAVAKAATTAVAYLESMFRRFDSVPSPGFTSGEHKGDWVLGGEHKGGDTHA